MEKLTNCPACTQNDITHLKTVKDYFLSQESFTIDICNSCGFQFTNPRPTIEEIGKYYQSDKYISHNSNQHSLFHRVYRWVRNKMTKKKIDIIQKYVEKDIQQIHLLDYGAATGDFLAACRDNKIINIVGIEQDANCRELAKAIHHIELKASSELHSLQDKSFDVITLWHVLEHIHNMEETILHFKRILNNKGILAIAVPNIIAFDSIYYKHHWAALDVPRHIYHFESKTIQVLMQRLGFKLVGTMNMPFDSYYISLHSEYYRKRKGIIAIIRAIIIGIISNSKAKKSNNYSSLTYLFKCDVTYTS